MKKTISYLLLGLSCIWGCDKNQIIDCAGGALTEQTSFIPLTEIEGYSENCLFGYYPDVPTHWIIQTTEEFDIWKSSLDCAPEDLIPVIDFEKYTLLVGFIIHGDTGIKFENQELLKSCTSQTYTYIVNFKDLPSGFTTLTTKNYGLLTDKISDDYQIIFEININE